ncbi:MAG TPA: MoaF N-terminal domain-containing protein [Sphingomonadaceae bacterium]|nr:MoaF N-terminal domain-containing protein [Sphingomonadaceae bacterium]
MAELEPIRPVPPMARDMDLEKNRLPSTQALAGETITLRYDDGAAAILRLGAERVAWSIEEEKGTQSGEDPYDAVELRPGIFFLHFASSDKAIGISHVIDRPAGRAVVAWDEAGGNLLRRHIRTARIGGHDGPYTPIPESRELIGRRAYCEYSEEAALEHVYVNSAAILWQWLLLPDDPRFQPLKTEVGIEAVSMRKVRDDLFLLTLNDGGPVGLTVLMDFAQKRNVGMLFGRTPAGLISRPVGAKIVLLNQMSYPAGYEPG